LLLFLAAGVIAALLRYYFDMDYDETWWLALLIGFISIVAAFGLRYLLVIALDTLFAAGAPATTPAGAPPTAPGGAAVVPAPAAPVNESAHDKRIRLRIEEKTPFVKDGAEFMQHGLRGRGQKQLYERLVEAGVTRMYVDMEGGNFLAPKFYAELPQDPAGRAGCFSAYNSYCQSARAEADPAEAKDTGQKYMMIQLKK
jgi:hypothetical protein